MRDGEAGVEVRGVAGLMEALNVPCYQGREDAESVYGQASVIVCNSVDAVVNGEREYEGDEHLNSLQKS